MSHRFSQWNHGANNVLIMDWDICIFLVLLNCVYFIQGKNHLAEFVPVLIHESRSIAHLALFLP